MAAVMVKVKLVLWFNVRGSGLMSGSDIVEIMSDELFAVTVIVWSESDDGFVMLTVFLIRKFGGL